MTREPWRFRPWEDDYPPGDPAGSTPSDILAREYSLEHPPAGVRSMAQQLVHAPEELTRRPQSIVQIPPPELVQYPIIAQSIYGSGYSAALADLSVTTLATASLPGGIVGVIRSVIVFAVNLVPTLVANFTVKINDAPVQGWTRAIPNQVAATAVISWGPDETLIIIPDGATVTIEATVVSGGPGNLGAQFAGWQYGAEYRDRYANVWR